MAWKDVINEKKESSKLSDDVERYVGELNSIGMVNVTTISRSFFRKADDNLKIDSQTFNVYNMWNVTNYSSNNIT